MKSDIFQNSTKSIPKNDPRIVRVDFAMSEIGARPSAMPKDGKNDNSIQHVKG